MKTGSKKIKPGLLGAPLAQAMSILGTAVFTTLIHLKGQCPYDGKDSNSPMNHNLESDKSGLFYHCSSGRKRSPSYRWTRMDLVLSAKSNWTDSRCSGCPLLLRTIETPQSLFKVTFCEASRCPTSVAISQVSKGLRNAPWAALQKRGHQFFFLTVKGLLHINKLILSLTVSIFLPERKTYRNNPWQAPSRLICSFHKVKMG